MTGEGPLLHLRDVRKSYRAPDGSTHVVLDLPELLVPEPREIALRGRSGSGKTTLLNVIAGLLTPDAGDVVVLGQDVAKMGESARDRFRADHLGYVFQTFNLLQGFSALENVLLGMLFGRGKDEAYARNLLTELGMGDRLDHKPAQLSIGQQQRVALARALANQPRLVLADEPTGTLDAANAKTALDAIRGMCREHGAALLLVSHDEDVLAGFEHVLALDELNRATGVAS